MPQEKTGEDLQAGGQSEAAEGREHGTEHGGDETERARLFAEGAGNGARTERLPHHA